MKNSFSIIISFVALSIIGAALVPLLNIQLKPNRTLPTLSVSYYWHNASAKVIEQEATSKLEGLFSQMQHIKKISSTSKKGYGLINIEFKKETDMDAVRFELSTRIRQLHSQLPQGLSYPTITKNTSDNDISPILSYHINAKANPSDIENIVNKTLISDLALIKGINNAKVYGAMPKEWVITYNVPVLQALNLNTTEIVSAIRQYFNKKNIGFGLASSKSEVTQVQLTSLHSSKLDWDRIPIKKIGTKIVYLKELSSSIQYLEKKPQSYFRINGLNTINLVIYPAKNVNIIRLTQQVRQRMNFLEKKLPLSFSMLNVFDAAKDLEKELNKIVIRALFSLLILFIFIVIVTRQPKYLLLITLSLAANLLIASIAYFFLKIEIQLYSLAGITISFGMVIDNSIIMIDHYSKTSRRNVFLPILGASLTSIGSLSIIFFLSEKQQANLIDFAWVIILNLTISLGTALFFIPALMSKIQIRKKETNSRRGQKLKHKFANAYSKTIRFNRKIRIVYFLIAILAFGIPFNLLPEKLEGNSKQEQVYNSTFGNKWFQKEVKPILEEWLGGTFRLFTEYVNENAYYNTPERTSLFIRGRMPDGCTVHQLNSIIIKMENFLSRFDEIEKYKTTIRSHRNAQIIIYFKPKFEKNNFPYLLKGKITSKAIVLGGLDWNVYGVGRGFSNSVGGNTQNNRIYLKGYNYEKLVSYAENLRQRLKQNSRIRNIGFKNKSWWKSRPSNEYNLKFKFDQLTLREHKFSSIYNSLQEKLFRQTVMSIPTQNKLSEVILQANQTEYFDMWHLHNSPLSLDEKSDKFQNVASIKKEKSGIAIEKVNQEYSLAVAFDFIGPNMLAKKVTKQYVLEMSKALPLGYNCELPNYSGWDTSEKSQYFLIGVVILIIFFVCSILFESLIQPLAIISMIPISFIGIFITFYAFDFNFDQGGFAAFILLAGLTVNAGIYIISEYNRLCKAKDQTTLEIFQEAFMNKITPIFLTIISTILGFIPFIYAGQTEIFWFAFAVGSIGGLLFSFIAILVYLPIMLKITA